MGSFDIVEVVSELGDKRVTPSDLFDDDDGRISKKTGISHLNRSSVSAYELAEAAVSKLKVLSANTDNIGYVIYVTQSPTNFLPNHASLIQHKFGINQSVMCFDMNQGCSGFVQALYNAVSLLGEQSDKLALIICADTYSHHLASDDRSTQALFSDGATATIIRPKGAWTISNVSHVTDGSGAGYLTKTIDPTNRLRMDGAAVFQWTRRILGKQIREMLAEQDMSVSDVDGFFIHQASKLVMDNVIKGLGVERDKVPSTLNLTGNLVSSSIPFLLENNFESFNKLKSVVLAGFGVGLSSTTCLLQKR